MDADLPARTQALHDRLKLFPEAGRTASGTLLKPDAWNALLELRQLMEREILPALDELGRKAPRQPSE